MRTYTHTHTQSPSYHPPPPLLPPSLLISPAKEVIFKSGLGKHEGRRESVWEKKTFRAMCDTTLGTEEVERMGGDEHLCHTWTNGNSTLRAQERLRLEARNPGAEAHYCSTVACRRWCGVPAESTGAGELGLALHPGTTTS